jgi:folylpolyglutamate synthase/dihydropteroate synthase
MKGKLQRVKARTVAMRQGNPMRGMRAVLVTGEYGRAEAACYMKAIFEAAGQKTSLLSSGQDRYDSSIEHFFSALARIKQEKPALVVIEVSENLEALEVLPILDIDSVVAVTADKHAEALLALGPEHLIGPTELTLATDITTAYQRISFGEDQLADAKVDKVTLYKKGLELNLTIDHQTKLEIASHLTGYVAAQALTAAIAAAYVRNIELGLMQDAIADIEPLRSSFRLQRLERPYATFTDVSSGHEAMLLAARSAKELSKRRLIIAVGGQIDADTSSELARTCSRLFIVSDKAGHSNIDSVGSAQEAYEMATRTARLGDSVLLLGEAFFDQLASDGAV